MRFKRNTVRYSETPVPATPYQAAAQCWDERLGSARVQAKNWRLLALASLGVALVLGIALVWQVARGAVTPFLVEVDAQGQVKEVTPAAIAYKPSDAQIAYHLSQFIQNVRSLSIDPVVVRQSWLSAYDYATERGAATLNEYARESNPFERVGKLTVAVEVTSVVRMSPASFQVRWIERSYSNGALAGTERWTAILSLALKQPRDEARLRKNPLGIYVDGLNWSRELAFGAG